jgi:hypothetical protein
MEEKWGEGDETNREQATGNGNREQATGDRKQEMGRGG